MKKDLKIISFMLAGWLVFGLSTVFAAEDYYEKTIEYISLYKDSKSKLAELKETCFSDECISQNSAYIELAKVMLTTKLDAFSTYSLGISEEILLKESASYAEDEMVLVTFVLSNLEKSLDFYRSYIENLNNISDLRQNELTINAQLEAGLSSIRVLAGKPELQELKDLQLQILEQRIVISAQAEAANSEGHNVTLLKKHLAEAVYYLDQTDLSLRIAGGFYEDISQSTSQVHATRKFEYQMEQTVQYLKAAHTHLMEAQAVLERLYTYKPWRLHE